MTYTHMQYQVLTEPVSTRPETVTEDRWHQPWSEPVRKRINPKLAIALAASGLFFTPQTVGEIINADKWYAPWRDPVRVKPGLRPAVSQNPLTFNPRPFVSFGWYGNLSEPVRIKRGLRASLQPFFTGDTTVIPTGRLLQWYAPWREPVRFKPGLRASLQQTAAWPPRLLPTPNITGTMAATETKDTFLAGASIFNPAASGEIGIVDASAPKTEIGVSASDPPGTIVSGRLSISIV